MRIALVCPYSCTKPGGVQTQVLGLARALASCGDEVAVVAPAETAGIAGRLDAEGLGGAAFFKVGTGTSVSVNGSQAPISPWPTTMARTLSALRAFSPDVVHVHEPLVPGPSLAATVFGPKPVVGTFHRSGIDLAYRSYGHVAGACGHRLAAAFAVSQEAALTARACVARLPEHVGIIPNGVEVERLASTRPWPTSGSTLAFVGRHESRKGLGVLLDAFDLVPPTTRLWVMGDGPETESLRSGSAGNARIEWLGVVGDEERAARMAGADLLIAPSLGGESFGVVLLEAMAVGTAVVASDVAGYRLAAGGAARFVPAGDVAALGDAIKDLLGDDVERKALILKGRGRAAECDMGVVADKYRAAYAQLS
jgi:phosphatidylinositol alpha-mannosyltransferase